jgi:hypothetical protein
VDRLGGSRTRMVMDYRLATFEGGTRITVDAEVTLAGAIAQFGRTSLMQETANILVRDFAGAIEAQLSPAAEPAAQAPDQPDKPAQPARREIRAGSLGLQAFWAWLKSLLRRLFP